MILDNYVSLIIDRPWLFVFILTLLLAIIGGIDIAYIPRPDFSEPTKGFEPRGTEIKGASLGKYHLDQAVANGVLSNFPSPFTEEIITDEKSVQSIDCDDFYKGHMADGLKFVFEASEPGSTLFTVDKLHAICQFEEEYLTTTEVDNWQCPAHSIGTYIGMLNDVSCLEITAEHVNKTLALISSCVNYYYIGALKEDCNIETCAMIPSRCYNNSAIYRIVHYLADSQFMSGSSELKYTMLITHPAEATEYKKVYDNVEVNGVSSTSIKLVSIHGHLLKFLVFDSYILQDMLLFLVAMISILLIMCLYLRSFLVTIATVFDVLFSFMLAYFVYHVVLRFKYFPFLNILAMLVLIAVGADDVFIFFDIWEQEKRENPQGTMHQRLKFTLRHASTSIFVTSFTTASAFMSNLVSEISSVKCFGLFAGLGILCNFFLMLTWIPAVVVTLDKYNCCTPRVNFETCNQFYRCCGVMRTTFHYTFSTFLPKIIKKLKLIWLVVVSAFGILGFIVVFGTPGLELPKKEALQLLKSSHLTEQYDINYKSKFNFNTRPLSGGMPLNFIWGILPVDNGNMYDPDSRGHMIMDTSFTLSSASTQAALTSFCHVLRNASFVFYNEFDCVLDNFHSTIISSNCSYIYDESCCSLPHNPITFDSCFLQYTEQFDLCNLKSVGCPYFTENGTLVAFSYDVISTIPFTTSYSYMDDFWRAVSSFMSAAEMELGEDISKGWFTSIFEFYDIQRALSSGTFIAMCVSLAFALVMMLVTSLNILITLYAIINIAFSISTTVGVLVLLGWKLNILESVIITLAVGLSIDFSIHYGIAYKLSPETKRSDRVWDSFNKVGTASFMAAFTTFVAGAAIMGARVKAYSQLGTFLMVVMAVSWFFATFFFQSLCCLAGPRGEPDIIPKQIASAVQTVGRRVSSLLVASSGVQQVTQRTRTDSCNSSHV